jgi:hypothetical protein
MWTVIIIFIVAFIAMLIYTGVKGDFEKGEHFDNLMFVLTSAFASLLICGMGGFLMFCGSAIYAYEATDPPKVLVETENYFIVPVRDNDYVSVMSDKYIYGTKDQGVVHLQEVVADSNTFVYIYEDIYTEEERPMLFIDHYTIGGTFFIDNFTFCGNLGKEQYFSFYVPEDSAGLTSIVIN